jgi:MoaA/NifB/PqqE/SkfB family radical SAM enzyme
MTLAQARGYIDQLAEMGSAKVVVFVGGEPLIHLDDICELIALTRSHGIQTQVSTNGFWASSPERARKVTRQLADAGLDHLALSADSYHTEFVDPANIGRAMTAAREAGLIRKLQVITSEVNVEGEALFAATGIDPGEVIDHTLFKLHRRDPEFDAKRYIILNRHAVSPFGRGAFLQGHALLRSLDALEDMPCFMALKFPIVYPNGEFYTCCCVAGRYKEYLVGNLDQVPLREMDRRMGESVIFEAIVKVGPVALAKSVRNEGADIGVGFSSPCHACRETLSRTEHGVLESHAQKLLLMQSLFEPDRERLFDALV